MKLDTAKGWIKMSNVNFKICNPDQEISFVRLFFFDAVMIIQTFLRGLNKLNVNTKCLGIEVLIIVETWVGKILQLQSSFPRYRSLYN